MFNCNTVDMCELRVNNYWHASARAADVKKKLCNGIHAKKREHAITGCTYPFYRLMSTFASECRRVTSPMTPARLTASVSPGQRTLRISVGASVSWARARTFNAATYIMISSRWFRPTNCS